MRPRVQIPGPRPGPRPLFPPVRDGLETPPSHRCCSQAVHRARAAASRRGSEPRQHQPLDGRRGGCERFVRRTGWRRGCRRRPSPNFPSAVQWCEPSRLPPRAEPASLGSRGSGSCPTRHRLQRLPSRIRRQLPRPGLRLSPAKPSNPWMPREKACCISSWRHFKTSPSTSPGAQRRWSRLTTPVTPASPAGRSR